MEVRLKPLLKGAASFFLPSLRTVHKKLDKMSAADAEFCYSLFLRHYSYVAPYFENGIPKVVAELGPGSSLGMGLCALLFGADIYYALDIVDHMDPIRNLHILDELVRMISERRPVPRHQTTFPDPACWDFPPGLTVPSRERLKAIRDDIQQNTKQFIRPFVPWASTEIPERAVSWLWSHSVMEHVDDIVGVWRSCATWLASNGIMTHEIDYQSHRLTKHWNGHWSTSDLCWQIIRGYRPYLINRLPHSAQMALAKSWGLEIVAELIYTPPTPALPANRLKPRFALETTPTDRVTGMAFVVLRPRSGKRTVASI
jgi:hypothetical protein